MQPRRLVCRFTPPEHGWLGVRIECPPAVVTVSASSIPADSVSELAATLLRVLRFETDGEVRWNEEPAAVLTVFERRGDRIRLRVDTVSAGRRATVLEHEDTARAIVAAFVSGLTQLTTECDDAQYEAGWRHPFPRDAVAQLERRTGPSPTGTSAGG